MVHTLKTILVVYILLCLILYFLQEKIIFQPEKLDKYHQFIFREPFEEITIKAKDGVLLNGLLFKADTSKGLIFYLHGNAGSLKSWGEVAKTYTDLKYDVFMLDYRGYGKSEGSISSQNQIFEDVRTAYHLIKMRYSENKIVVLGYSLGTGPATKLASEDNPKLLILQAPYYSLTEAMKDNLPFIPTFLLKYKFATNEYLKSCKMPIVIFHGDQDEIFPYTSSVRLKAFLKPTDRFFTLKGQSHNGITENEIYRNELRKLLQ